MSKKVLIVDDSRVMRSCIVKVLRHVGFDGDFAEAANFTEAMAQLAAGNTQLIISELNFPNGESGLDLIRQVRKTPAYRSLPALLLTNNLDETQIARALAAGFTGCLKDLTDTFEVEAVVSPFLE